jgi:hypothetical protein
MRALAILLCVAFAAVLVIGCAKKEETRSTTDNAVQSVGKGKCGSGLPEGGASDAKASTGGGGCGGKAGGEKAGGCGNPRAKAGGG